MNFLNKIVKKMNIQNIIGNLKYRDKKNFINIDVYKNYNFNISNLIN